LDLDDDKVFLDINSTNFKKIKMLDPNLISIEYRNKIVNAFKPILNRNMLRTGIELDMEDRILFDKLVLKAYGIEELYSRTKDSLLHM